MDLISQYLQGKIPFLLLILALVLTNIGTGYFLYQERNTPCVCEATEECPEQVLEEEKEKMKVDLKGYVENPGVYELEEGAILLDLINLAGGVKSGGTTDNLNLSKKLKDEDVIVVLSKNELKKQNSETASSTLTKTDTSKSTTINESTKIETNQKISLNTASKEELMTLNGIGEAKALSIIEYRTKTPFKEISEIMNISGIGEATYAKIKDSITI